MIHFETMSICILLARRYFLVLAGHFQFKCNGSRRHGSSPIDFLLNGTLSQFFNISLFGLPTRYLLLTLSTPRVLLFCFRTGTASIIYLLGRKTKLDLLQHREINYKKLSRHYKNILTLQLIGKNISQAKRDSPQKEQKMAFAYVHSSAT